MLCVVFRWLKFEEDVEDGGERWSKPYVATLSLHSLFELRSCIMNGTVLLDMRANTIEEIAGQPADQHCIHTVRGRSSASVYQHRHLFIYIKHPTDYIKHICDESRRVRLL